MTTSTMVGGCVPTCVTYSTLSLVPSLVLGPRVERMSRKTSLRREVGTRVRAWSKSSDAVATASRRPTLSTLDVKTIGQ